MKNTSKILVMLLFVAVIFGCKKDDDNPTPNPNNPMAAYIKGASYKFVINGKTVAEGDCSAISSYPGAEEDNVLILFKGDIMVTSGEKVVASITGIPYTVGGESNINNNIGLALFNLGTKKTFLAKEGVIARTANNKISFSGVGFFSGNNDEPQEFSGSITSKTIETIKK